MSLLKGPPFKQYYGLYKSVRLYYNSYGGFWALIFSPYLHLSFLISYLLPPFWRCPGREGAWFDVTLSILPNILGFTLGGYAILLAFGDESFRKFLSGKKEDGSSSPFMMINGTFVHFIVIQTLAILMAVICKAWAIKVGGIAFIGFTLFIYSMMTAIAAVFAVLRMAEWFDKFKNLSQ